MVPSQEPPAFLLLGDTTMKTWPYLFLLLAIPAMAAESAHVVAKADVTVSNTATLVLAANGLRSTLSCTNTSTSVAVRWGDSSVSATKGQQIPAGATIEIRNSGAVYMISEGADVTVACTEEQP
jgi:hypothetical protein